MRFLTADYIFLPQGILPEKALCIDDSGTIMAILPASEAPGDATHYKGLLSPGFVNAHCHLELSFLKGLIPEGTGMAGFIQKIGMLRNRFPLREQAQAAQNAAEKMWAEGIVAVGDISNTAVTAGIKAQSAIHFHTFVECFGLDPQKADSILKQAIQLFSIFPVDRSSLTLHAPYSVSKALRNQLYTLSNASQKPLSIHLLESEEERHLFEEQGGPLYDLMHSFYQPLSLAATNSALAFILEGFPESVPTLWVHATEINKEELRQLTNLNIKSNLVLCPNANLYIHNKLPDIPMLLDWSKYICLGTDSLASNHQLSILEEAKVLQKAFPSLPGELLLQWGTINGARALGVDTIYGSFEKGKKPGVVLIEGFDGSAGHFTKNAAAKRIL